MSRASRYLLFGFALAAAARFDVWADDDVAAEPQEADAGHGVVAETAREPAFEAPAANSIGANLLVEFESYRARASRDGFGVVEENVLSALSAAQTDARADAAKRVLYLYFAHALYAEALAFLGERNDVAADPVLALLAGVANYKLGRYDDAVEVLSADVLRNVDAAASWRGMANAKRGAHAAANLPDAPQFILPFEGAAVDFFLLKAETEIAAGALEAARLSLNHLRRFPLDEDDRAHRAYLEARAMAGSHRRNAARDALRRLAASDRPPISVRAELELLKDAALDGALAPAQAAQAADILLLQWRGGAPERETLAFAAAMRARAGDIAAAFRLRRRLTREFPNADIAKEATAAMRADLASLFERYDLAPLEASKIFYENIDFAPPGREGDALIRNVAGELASLDLLAQAAELLEHQTFHRLRGEQRSRAAADLAQLYLDDGEAREALRVLRSTRLARLPHAVNARRRQLEARALAATDAIPAALALLEKDATRTGAMLRAEIYWSEEQWKASGDAFRAAAGLGAEPDAVLSRRDSLFVLRAASAYALAGAGKDLRALGEDAANRLSDEDANHLLAALVGGGPAENPARFREAYRKVFDGEIRAF